MENLPSSEWAWIICHFGLGGTPKVGDYPRSISNGRNPRSILPGPGHDLYIGVNEPLSRFVPAGVLHRGKVFPWEMSSAQPNPPSFISKCSKTAGQRYIDTPGTVYLEVFVDSPQGCIVLSVSFAGAAVQKTKEPADT